MFSLQPSKILVFTDYISSTGALFRSFFLENLFFRMEAVELTSDSPSYQCSYSSVFGKKIKRIVVEFNHASLVKSNVIPLNFYFRKHSHNVYTRGIISKSQLHNWTLLLGKRTHHRKAVVLRPLQVSFCLSSSHSVLWDCVAYHVLMCLEGRSLCSLENQWKHLSSKCDNLRIVFCWAAK